VGCPFCPFCFWLDREALDLLAASKVPYFLFISSHLSSTSSSHMGTTYPVALFPRLYSRRLRYLLSYLVSEAGADTSGTWFAGGRGDRTTSSPAESLVLPGPSKKPGFHHFRLFFNMFISGCLPFRLSRRILRIFQTITEQTKPTPTTPTST